jgi:hypothetical protein
MSAGNVTRIVAVVAACAAAAGSATSSSSQRSSLDGPGDQSSPPPPQQMDGARALGLWRSTFGAVKIEADNRQGGLASGNLQGIWVYERQGQEVIGYFAGNLRGNVLQFRWQEPSNPPLTGEGYLVFDVEGRQYAGRWWSDKRDRIGDWRGWRETGAQQAGRGDAVPPPSPYRRPQSYQRQPYEQPYEPSQSPPPQQPSPYQQPQQQPSPYQQPQQQPSPYQQPQQQPQPPPPTYY